jgi:hypothetical protein
VSVNDLNDHIESIALEALFKAKAIEECRFHPEVTIRVGDSDAERHAYALATTLAKAKDEMFLREDLMESIKLVLDMAADDECPQCAYLRSK